MLRSQLLAKAAILAALATPVRATEPVWVPPVNAAERGHEPSAYEPVRVDRQTPPKPIQAQSMPAPRSMAEEAAIAAGSTLGTLAATAVFSAPLAIAAGAAAGAVLTIGFLRLLFR